MAFYTCSHCEASLFSFDQSEREKTNLHHAGTKKTVSKKEGVRLGSSRVGPSVGTYMVHICGGTTKSRYKKKQPVVPAIFSNLLLSRFDILQMLTVSATFTGMSKRSISAPSSAYEGERLLVK